MRIESQKDKMLENVNKKDAKNQLLEDKKYKQEISNFVIYNQVYNFLLKKFKFIKKNNKEIVKLFNEFLEKDEFGLKKVYKNIISYNGVIRLGKSDVFDGCTIYVPSLDKNYIKIFKSKKIYEYLTLVHELGHAKLNLINGPLKEKNSFIECYPIFLELVFCDWLKKNGKQKLAFNMELLMLLRMRENLNDLYETITEYLSSEKTSNYNKFYFEMKYKKIKSELLAFEFYNLYLNDKEKALTIVNKFIILVKNENDNNLIKLLGIDENYLSNKTIYRFYDRLRKEKIKIKTYKTE